MSKIKHWNETTQSWEIDGASNAANIELTNPAYLDENGDSISVDQGFTKVGNRLSKMEKNLAWIYQNGAKGGGGGGGGGGESTEYTITVEEGNRVYTANTSVTIHITINGGSLRKIFQVEITNAQTGERLASPTVTGLTRTEITINGLSDSTQVLKISAHTGLYYASDYILTVVAGAIKLSRTRLPQTTIYPTTSVYSPILTATNSTGDNLLIVVEYTKDEINYSRLTLENDIIENTGQASYNFTLSEVAAFLNDKKTSEIGETYTFNIYVQGVLNDNLLKSNVISFSTTITAAGVLYILTYGINKSVPENDGDLESLTRFVYGQSIQFDYELSFSDARFPMYTVDYEICQCYFEDGVLVHKEDSKIVGQITPVERNKRTIFSCSTASLPSDTIYDAEDNIFKFIRVKLTATSTIDPEKTDEKIVYFTLSKVIEKYITATNFDRSLVCYFSPVMGVPMGNVTTWTYDNQNTRFPYNTQGIVHDRYVSLNIYNANSVTNGYSSQGMHMTGKAYALLNLNLFSSEADQTNLISGDGFTISTTFRTDGNIDPSDTVLSFGNYIDDNLAAGIEILAEKIRVLVNNQETSLNITKGDLVTVDIVFEKYVGLGDDDDAPNHWFIKIYLNGVLSSLGSQPDSSFTSNALGTAWYFTTPICLGARVEGEEVISSANVHFYDFKIYSTALSDNEITQNYVSATIYSELANGASPQQTLQTELLSKNFIQINTEGEYESLLFDQGNPREYKDPDTLLSTLRAALADSKIPYPIVVINQLTPNSNFYGTTQAQFSEDQKYIVTGEEYRYPINMDYYTMGNSSAIRISNESRMKISIQGTSSLQFVSKNYEIYMGKDSDINGRDVLVQMREDWLPENEFTLKADVMDSAHVNNVLIGKIINGLVTTTDSSGNEVQVKPLDNTPPMNINNSWASKIKHTSEGYPVILFINFKNNDGTTVCRCQGIYNFNLGRAASFNLGLKLLNSCTFVDNSVSFPRMVEDYEESLVISNGAPVYSIEVGENNQQIGAFDQGSTDIVSSGLFDPIYYSDGAYNSNLLKLLNFLASFGANVYNPKKVQIDGQWCTPKVIKDGSSWITQNEYYYPMNAAYYTQDTLERHMNWNNLVSYYMIAIVFGLVDSMGKNLTLRTWNTTADENGVQQCVWYMCFYDMDTAMRLDNDGNESIPYNAHLNRYYTDNSGIFSIARMEAHASSISGVFSQVYSSPNTRLQEIAENITAESNSKTLRSVYENLRTTLFPDPGIFIDTYYTGQINQIGAALYNYDYKLKYLQTKKQYSVATGELVNSKDYNQISYLHGNGATNIKSWFKRRIRFLDGIYGTNERGNNTINGTGITDLTLSSLWSQNQADYAPDKDPTIISLTLSAESQTLINISAGEQATVTLWINETPQPYKVRNVTGRQRYSFYGNDILTTLDGFEKFRWVALDTIAFPRIKKLSLKDQKEIIEGFLIAQGATDLESLVELDLSGVTLVNTNAQVVYKKLEFTANLPNLQILDISGSSFNDVALPESGVLKYLDLSDTKIASIKFNGQPMLETLNINGCIDLKRIELTNCPKLRNLTVPASVEYISIVNCQGLQSISCTWYDDKNISPLTYIFVSDCNGLKRVTLSGQNNPLLEIDLRGAEGLEELYFNRIETTNITLPSKSRWHSLKSLDISNTKIGAFNYAGEIATYLDLTNFNYLSNLNAQNNYYISEVHCPNIANQYIELTSGAFYSCSGLSRLIGNFKLAGNRIFQGCSNLIINQDYSGIDYTSTYIPDDFCNITFHDALGTYSEMFAGCSRITGQDFRYIMDKVKPVVTDISKMFQGCINIKTNLWSDIFSKCPHIINMVSFCEGTGITGAFYGGEHGILSYIPDVEDISLAFSNSGLQWIDNDAFLGCSSIREADQVFWGCSSLTSCTNTYDINPTAGYLDSKTFFMNLSGLDGIFPERMFMGCRNINMTVHSEQLPNGVIFDYLFHYPASKTYTETTLTDSLYTGVNLCGDIHVNVFGGIESTDGEFNIPSYTIISSPFANCGTNLRARLGDLGQMFQNLNPVSLIGVLQGIRFYDDSSNYIPNDIFSTCTNLINISGFFSNVTIKNNGQPYEFPHPDLFRNCTKLINVSNLFSGDKYLNIKLIGGGFVNNPIQNFSGMLQNSGVFGTIPYKFLRTTGKTITNLSNIFRGCFKLGYTMDRRIDENTPYKSQDIMLSTNWEQAVIENPGTPMYFELDTNVMPEDEYYIDGRPWTGDWLTSQYYDSTVQDYDLECQEALSQGNILRTEGCFQNYMFPADLFYSCSDECSLESALNGLSYTTNKLVQDESGIYYLQKDKQDGLKGRLPMKLFKNMQGVTVLKDVFRDLLFCPFIGFSSNKYDVQSLSAEASRGIKLPPDLFEYTPNITTLNATFQGITVEEGIDLNLNLSYLPNLQDVTSMLSNIQFNDSPVSGGLPRIDDNTTYYNGNLVFYPQLSANSFMNNHQLRVLQSLFAVTDPLETSRGLLHVSASMFDPSDQSKHPYLTNVSSVFYNNRMLSGSIPIMSGGSYISSHASYVEGVNKMAIENADAYISSHSTDLSWIPLSWRTE